MDEITIRRHRLERCPLASMNGRIPQRWEVLTFIELSSSDPNTVQNRISNQLLYIYYIIDPVRSRKLPFVRVESGCDYESAALPMNCVAMDTNKYGTKWFLVPEKGVRTVTTLRSADFESAASVIAALRRSHKTKYGCARGARTLPFFRRSGPSFTVASCCQWTRKSGIAWHWLSYLTGREIVKKAYKSRISRFSQGFEK
jgi:hypothetical protein